MIRLWSINFLHWIATPILCAEKGGMMMATGKQGGTRFLDCTDSLSASSLAGLTVVGLMLCASTMPSAAAPIPATAFSDVIESFEKINDHQIDQPIGMPDDISNGAFSEDGRLQIFIEQERIELSQPFTVSLSPQENDIGQTFDDKTDRDDTVGPGVFNSTIISRDRPQFKDSSNVRSGIFNFADPIIGISTEQVDGSDDNFFTTTQLFSRPETNYGSQQIGGSSFEILDTKSLRVSLSVGSGLDRLRVITLETGISSIPAPASSLLLIPGAILALWRRFC